MMGPNTLPTIEMDLTDIFTAITFAGGVILLAISGPIEFQPIVFTGFALTIVGMGAIALRELVGPDPSPKKVSAIGLLIIGYATVFFEAAGFAPHDLMRPVTVTLFAVAGLLFVRMDSRTDNTRKPENC